MTLTPRRRAVVAILVMLPIGWLFLDIGWRLVFDLLQRLRGSTPSCGSSLTGAIRTFNGCGSFGDYKWGYAVVELLLMTAVVTAAAYGLARWVTFPVRDIAGAVERFGPNSLGLRLRRRGPRDETRQLAEAIDAMLDRLAEGYEAQRRFAANASHELRTPLATQRALIEVSLGSALTPDQRDLLTRQLLATNERNERLIDGLLTLAETEQGLRSEQPQRLDQVAADAIETWRTAAEQARVTVHADLAPVTVSGELPLLERLAGNLVQNAIKYNHPGGTVRVAVTPPGTLAVANTGAPVPSEHVGLLFEPFRRLSGERLDHGGGAGLGLTIARSIVAAHGGRITARANPDGGLTVDVQL